MSTQINPSLGPLPPVTREVPPVPLADRMPPGKDERPPREEDRREPRRDEAEGLVVYRGLTENIAVVAPGLHVPAPSSGDTTTEVAAPETPPRTGNREETRGATVARIRLPEGVAPGAATALLHDATIARALLPPVQTGRQGNTDVNAMHVDAVHRTDGSGEVSVRQATLSPVGADAPAATPNREQAGMDADEGAQPRRGDTGVSSGPIPSATLSPTTTAESRSTATPFPGSPQQPPTPTPQSRMQERAADAPPAASELTFAFKSWGGGQTVTATLARSGYVYLNPSSERVGTALTASKPEEHWLVGRTASTGDDDNDNGKQRRKRQ